MKWFQFFAQMFLSNISLVNNLYANVHTAVLTTLRSGYCHIISLGWLTDRRDTTLHVSAVLRRSFHNQTFFYILDMLLKNHINRD